jgi:hypothetical protein
MLSEAYSWSLEYVAELDIDDAIALLQEIATSEQTQREWEWMLSENSISYDKRSGKGSFQKLRRPDWMDRKKAPEKKRHTLGDKIPMKKSMMPVGNVVKWNDGKLDA